MWTLRYSYGFIPSHTWGEIKINLPKLVILTVSVTMALMIARCGMVESFGEMQEQTEKTSTAIEKAIGIKPQIGWNINNGKLVEVNVYFDQFGDESITVTELKKQIKNVVTENMEQMPQQLLISINATD